MVDIKIFYILAAFSNTYHAMFHMNILREVIKWSHYLSESVVGIHSR